MTYRLPQLPVYKKTLTAIALTGLFTMPLPVAAETAATEEWNISADKIIHYENPRSIIAEGNIVLEKREALPPPPPATTAAVTAWDDLLEEEQKTPESETIDAVSAESDAKPAMQLTTTIKADWMAYDVEKQSIKAKGNVKVFTPDDTLTASQGKVDLNTTTGTFTDAVIIAKDKDLHLEGKTVEKTGFNTYHIDRGWVITCKLPEGDTAPWSFASSDTTIEKGGYAVLKHARFNIRGVPVFYTPYLIIPVKDTRQTGLLFPEFSFSDNSGFGVNLPFFLNISDSTDLTVFPEYMTDRGFMPGLEFRYVRSETNKGSFIASYLDDELSDPSETEYYADTGFTHTNSDRYWLRGKADGTIGDSWQVRLDVDVASDADYLTEFNRGYTGFDKTESRFLNMYGRAFDNETSLTRENKLGFLKGWEGMSLETTFLAVNDLVENREPIPYTIWTTAADGTAQQTTGLYQLPTPLWKLPGVTFDGVLPISSSSVSLNWETDYVNYWREEGIGAHRVDLHPSISSPVPISQYLESRAELGVRETLYAVQEYGEATWDEDTQNRFLADFHYEVGTTLVRNFDLSNSQYTGFDHQIHPFIKYDFIPDVDQDKLVYLDDADRVSEENGVTYGLDNFFNVLDANALARQYGQIQIEQSYSFLDESPDDPYDANYGKDYSEHFSDVSALFRLTPATQFSLEYQFFYDVYESKISSHSVEGSYTTSRGDYFSIDYSFYDPETFDDSDTLIGIEEYVGTTEEIEQIDAHVRTRLFERWLAEAEVEHSLTANETNTANVSLTYEALCWSIELQSNYTPTDTQFVVVFNLANIGTPLGLNLQ